MDKENEKKIEELQILENHLQGLLAQRQGIQIELNETENAIKELKNYNDEVYKIVSGIMIKTDNKSVVKELQSKKEVLDMKIGAVEKQEKLIEKRTSELREEVNRLISKGGKNKQ